jgi:hypothetical protein
MTAEKFGKMYQLPDGRVLWVGAGLGGDVFMTFKSSTQAWGRHRFVSKNLPVRKSFDEAQADLDAFAAKGRLPEFAEEEE